MIPAAPTPLRPRPPVAAAVPVRRAVGASAAAVLALALLVPAAAAAQDAPALRDAPAGQAAPAAQDAPAVDPAEGPVRPHPEAVRAISRLRSPYCPGLMLEVCPSGDAAVLRDSIRMLAREGWAADSIVEWMLANHGEEWRAVPRTEGAGLWAWAAPPFALLLGLALVVVALRRLRGAPVPVDREGAEGAEGAQAVGADDRERLRAAIREMEEREEAGL